ncbi:MAG TPA: hypothetical protein VIM02_16225 [Rhizomicrobium sp.]|jgi:hypothetical protein
MFSKTCAALLAFGFALGAGNALAANNDPFDSPLGDKLDACKYSIAHSFRYDFDHVEIPAAEQALAAFHNYCRAELETLRALFPNWSALNADNQSIADRVDENALASFWNAQNDIQAEQDASGAGPKPGDNKLGNQGRLSVFDHSSPVSPDETASVYRHDALGWYPDFSFRGHIGEWTYRYEPNPSSGWPPQRWWAFLDRGEIEAVITCDSLGPPEQACRLDFIRRTPKEMGFLSLRAGGTPFTIGAVCDPGGSGIVLDAPQLPNDIDARHASLILDDQDAIALPDGDRCDNDSDGSLAKRILGARHFASRYAPPFRERVIDVEGTADALAPALTLARQVYWATRAEAGGPRFLSEMAELSKRAEPFTLEDALQSSLDWARARKCLSSHGLSGDACRAELQDLDWRAAMAGASMNQQTDDNPLSIQGARPRIEAARKMVAESAESLTLSARSSGASASSDHERAANVMGHEGFVGIKSETPYGYFLAADVAEGAVTGPFARDDEESRGPATIVIRCRARQNCTVQIPFETGSGGLRIETDGGRADANVCVDSAIRNWKGWMLAQEYSTQVWRLGPDHCVGAKSGAVLTNFLNHAGVRLRAPGKSKETSTRLVAPSHFDLVLALTNYLSDKANHAKD